MCARERERDAKTNTRELVVTRISLSLFILFSERRREEQNQKKCALLLIIIIVRDDQIETLGKTIKKHETYHFRVLPRCVILLDERNHILRRDWYGT